MPNKNSVKVDESNKDSTVKELSGKLKDKVPAGIKWKKIKADYLKKKHGL